MIDTNTVVIVGGGHNGLVCAAYLAKAGRKVTVLEAADQLGGAAATREFAPGYNASVAHLLNLLGRDFRELFLGDPVHFYTRAAGDEEERHHEETRVNHATRIRCLGEAWQAEHAIVRPRIRGLDRSASIVRQSCRS